jgi:hypothetical protein
LRFPRTGARAFVPAILAATLIFTAAPPPPAAASSSSASAVLNVAKAQMGRPWVYGAAGPSAFDCSGLVIYAFRQTGHLPLIGNGKYRSARAIYQYFAAQGKASRTNGAPGDLVVWGGGSHLGIYLGGGMAVSTLTSGVAVHKVHAVTASFTAFLKTGLSGQAAAAVTAAAAPTRAASSTTAVTGPRTTVNLNQRRGPGLNHGVIRVLPTGTQLSVLERRRDIHGRIWLRVNTTRGSGWVASWFTR